MILKYKIYIIAYVWINAILLYLPQKQCHSQENHTRPPRKYEYIKNNMVISSENIEEIKKAQNFVEKSKIEKYDTIISIGSWNGNREFLWSLFTDSVHFYLQDVDISSLTKFRIEEVCIPHYSKMRQTPVTNTFAIIKGTQKHFGINDNSVSKVIMYNVYHHFKNDIIMVKEAKRVLQNNGNLIIWENVTERNMKTRRYCGDKGKYKTQENFVNDIVNLGFICDTVYKDIGDRRIFFFTKKTN
ncbi:MAG: class I SAM-dependent methyltransferase [Bacteroidales bacterium]|jgi:ubiquinone/menaquinone biosynthesis C-methylase UbiE|nr:class I SAM-dependent methyltransferase [Bacteroidales bacterium]